MIHSYTCKNFYSIGDKVEVKFDVNKNAPESDAYMADGDLRVSLIEAIVGPNASGKTNVIKALAFIRHLITNVSDDDFDSDIQFACFAGQSSIETKVSVNFTVDGRFLSYSFTLSKGRIIHEALREQSESTQRLTKKTLFTREWDKHNKAYVVSDKAFGVPSGVRPRDNASIASTVALVGDSESLAKKIVNYWRNSVVCNVWERGNLDDHPSLHNDALTRKAVGFFYDNPQLKEAALDILRKIGVGFHDFEREELRIANRVSYGVKHRYSGEKEFSIPLSYESSGTKRAILILRYIVQALQRPGGIAAIDELDAYLHPDIVEALVKLFMSRDTNPNGAQLLFSSHSHQLLAEFDKQQITLVEKDDNGETEVWRLDSVTGVRADDNYYTKYIAGAYGAKPRLS